MKKYIKLYEETETIGSRRLWDDVKEYLEDQGDTYVEFLKKHDDDPVDKKIQTYLYWIDNPYLLGVYESFKKKDWKILNDAIHQDCRHRMLNLNASGYDHSGGFWIAMDCMGCNYTEALEKLFPEKIGLCNNGYPTFVVASNLLYVIWYQKEALAEKVVLKAKKILNQKKSLWEKAIVGFLLALYERNMEEASIHLNQVCKLSRRTDRDKLYKFFCLEAHGLYNIARKILPKEMFEQIRMPQDEAFLEDFALWQKRVGYPDGEPFIFYPEELDFMNRILKCPLPESRIHSPYEGSKKIYQDEERMKKELAEQINK